MCRFRFNNLNTGCRPRTADFHSIYINPGGQSCKVPVMRTDHCAACARGKVASARSWSWCRRRELQAQGAELLLSWWPHIDELQVESDHTRYIIPLSQSDIRYHIPLSQTHIPTYPSYRGVKAGVSAAPTEKRLAATLLSPAGKPLTPGTTQRSQPFAGKGASPERIQKEMRENGNNGNKRKKRSKTPNMNSSKNPNLNPSPKIDFEQCTTI